MSNLNLTDQQIYQVAQVAVGLLSLSQMSRALEIVIEREPSIEEILDGRMIVGDHLEKLSEG